MLYQMICFRKPRFHISILKTSVYWITKSKRILSIVYSCQFTKASVNVTLRLVERYGSRSQGSSVHIHTRSAIKLINLNWSFLRPAHYLTPQIQFTVNFTNDEVTVNIPDVGVDGCSYVWCGLSSAAVMCCDAVRDIMQALCVIRTNEGWSPTGPSGSRSSSECKFRKFSE